MSDDVKKRLNSCVIDFLNQYADTVETISKFKDDATQARFYAGMFIILQEMQELVLKFNSMETEDEVEKGLKYLREKINELCLEFNVDITNKVPIVGRGES